MNSKPNYRDAAREAFESETALARMRPVFLLLRSSCASFEPFESLDAFLAFQRDAANDRATKDALLLALLRTHQRGSPRGVHEILVLAMRPKLEKLCGFAARAAKLEDRDVVAADVYGAFVNAADAYPLERRPEKVASNLYHLTFRAYLKASHHQQRRVDQALAAYAWPLLGTCTDKSGVRDWYGGIDVLALAKPEKPAERADSTTDEDLRDARALAAIWVEKRILTQEDAELLVQAHALGRGAEELAVEHGIRARGMRKRLRRLEATVRRAHEEETEDS